MFPDVSLFSLWSQIFANFVVPQAPKMPTKDRKLAAVGLTRILTQSNVMLQGPNIMTWYVACEVK